MNKYIIGGAVMITILTTMAAELTEEWDKTFPKSEKVEHCKVTFKNRFGITLAADVYKPKNCTGECGTENGRAVAPRPPKSAAIAVSGPFGAVKEQASGLYAQTLGGTPVTSIGYYAFYGCSGAYERDDT